MIWLNNVYLDSDSLGPGIALNRPACEHRWTSYAHSDGADIVSRLAGADIAIVNKIGLDFDSAKSDKPTQEFELSADDVKALFVLCMLSTCSLSIEQAN